MDNRELKPMIGLGGSSFADGNIYVSKTKTGHLIMKTSIRNNEFMRGFPNRRWDQNKMAWIVHITRQNILYIKESSMYHNERFKFDEPAVLALQEADQRFTEMEKIPLLCVDSFPKNYPFKRNPRLKQLDALNKTYGIPTVALFMDMRTGKSKVIIDTIACRRMEDLVRRVIIVCPLSIRMNWVNEFKKDCPIDFDIHLLNSDKVKQFQVWDATPHDLKVLIVGSETLSGSQSAFEMCMRFMNKSSKTQMVIDESTSVKNHKSIRFKRCFNISKVSEFKIIATGTPTGLGPEDLYAQFQVLDPDIIGIGDFYSFRNQYCEMGGFGGKRVVGYQNLESLMRIIEPYIYQARKSDVFPDDPDKVYQVRRVNMTDKQKALYNEVKKDGRATLSNGNTLVVENILEKCLRLQEITGGHIAVPNTWDNSDKKFEKLRIEGGNPKLNEMINVIEDVGKDNSFIIWCAFKPEIYMVVEALRAKYGDENVVEVHGDINEEQKNHNVFKMFQSKLAKFLVGNTQSAGMGLTLDAADVEIYLSNTHRFIDREQSEERAFASGKKLGTLIVDIVCENTIDLHVLQAMGVKRDLSEYVRQSITDIKAADALFDGDVDKVNLDTIDTNHDLF